MFAWWHLKHSVSDWPLPLCVFQVPLRMKSLLEPCGPQGVPFSPPSGTTEVVEATAAPWQSVQNMVCVPTAFDHGRRQLPLMSLPLPRVVPLRSVLSMTGCHERWLLVANALAAPESVVVVSFLCVTGARISFATFV